MLLNFHIAKLCKYKTDILTPSLRLSVFLPLPWPSWEAGTLSKTVDGSHRKSPRWLAFERRKKFKETKEQD